MPIQVQCPCGQVLAAPESLAGKQAKCPKCQQPLAIPPPQAVAAAQTPQPTAPQPNPNDALGIGSFGDLLDEAGLEQQGGTPCPKCNAGMPPGAILCVKCGFHIEMGERLETHYDPADEEEHYDPLLGNKELESQGNATLDKANRDLEREKAMQKRLNKGTPAWILFLMLCGVLGSAGVIAFLPHKDKWAIAGAVAAGSFALPILRLIVRSIYLKFFG